MIEINSLEWKNFSFAYDNGGAIFENVNFVFPRHRVVSIEAAGSTGKSTLLRLLVGLLMPQRGEYFVNDQNVAEMSFEEFLPYRLNMSYAFDLGGLLNNRTLQENILLPLMYHNVCDKEEAERRMTPLVELFQIGPYLHFRPSAVTGSIRKATCIVRALITQPQILFLDDPTTGLSRQMAERLARHLGGLQHAKQIYIASEDKAFINGMSEFRIQIDRKTLVGHPVDAISLRGAG